MTQQDGGRDRAEAAGATCLDVTVGLWMCDPQVTERDGFARESAAVASLVRCSGSRTDPRPSRRRRLHPPHRRAAHPQPYQHPRHPARKRPGVHRPHWKGDRLVGIEIRDAITRLHPGLLEEAEILLAWMLHLPPSAVSLVSDVRFCRSAQRLARLTRKAEGRRFDPAPDHHPEVFTFQWGSFSRLGLTFWCAVWLGCGRCHVVCGSCRPDGFLCSVGGFRACCRCCGGCPGVIVVRFAGLPFPGAV